MSCLSCQELFLSLLFFNFVVCSFLFLFWSDKTPKALFSDFGRMLKEGRRAHSQADRGKRTFSFPKFQLFRTTGLGSFSVYAQKFAYVYVFSCIFGRAENYRKKASQTDRQKLHRKISKTTNSCSTTLFSLSPSITFSSSYIYLFLLRVVTPPKKRQIFSNLLPCCRHTFTQQKMTQTFFLYIILETSFSFSLLWKTITIAAIGMVSL